MAKRKPAERLRAWRKRNGLTQADASGWLGCSQQMVAALESGDRLPGRIVAANIEFYAGIKTKEWK